MGWNERADFEKMAGQTIVTIEGASEGSETITFTMADGGRFVQLHRQDCCESVSVAEVVGDLDSIIGQEVMEAREHSNNDNPPEHAESHTWTFYTIRTNRGTVVIRWLGESNGYYSESADVEYYPPEGAA